MPRQGIPIKRDVPVPTAGAAAGLLLVGHGSRCVRSEVEMHALAGIVGQAMPDVAVGVGFLEMTNPPAGAVLDQLVATGCRTIVVLPLVLLGAGHAKSDVPAVILDARSRHPRIDIRFGGPLGVTREPVELLGKAVIAAGGAGLPLLVVARGTSDPDANSDAYKAARLLAEWSGAPFTQVGFSGVAGPTVPEAAGVFHRLGMDRIAVAWWYLCHGKLIEQGRDHLADFSYRSGVAVVDAGHLGPDPGLLPLIMLRYREAVEGHTHPNCDICAYRAPWPGRERRVGQALGVGHSHLAVAHRHAH